MDKQTCLTCGTTYTDRPYMDRCMNCKSEYISRDHKDWKNYGDINFTTFGGCLVRNSFTPEEIKEYPELTNYFDVFYLFTPFDIGEGDDVYKAFLYSSVCITDFEHVKQEVLTLVGEENNPAYRDKKLSECWTPERVAVELVESGYADDCRTYWGHILDDEKEGRIGLDELYKWFCTLGIDDDFVWGL